MKITKYLVAFLATLTLASCSSEEEILIGSGNLTIEFDNSYSSSDLLLNTTTYAANDTEDVKISKVKYIVSNIRLVDEDGNVFTYPKNDSYFLVQEGDTDSQFINLTDIPAANYTKIMFGIGVDQEKYLEGATGQGDFLTLAQDAGMMWSWQAGYKFFVFEGVYTSSATTTETAFAFHMGSHGSSVDNYKEVTLDLTNSARVRNDISPEIHVVADLSKVLSGATVFLLDDAAQIHVDAVKSPQIATNINGMFSIDHVHN